jgi:hypothetical protein
LSKIICPAQCKMMPIKSQLPTLGNSSYVCIYMRLPTKEINNEKRVLLIRKLQCGKC